MAWRNYFKHGYFSAFCISIIAFASAWFWIGTKDYSTLTNEGYKHVHILHQFISNYKCFRLSFFWDSVSLYPPLFYLPGYVLNKLTGAWSESLLLASMAFYVPFAAISAFLVSKKIMNTPCALSSAFFSSAIQLIFVQKYSFVSDYVLAPVILLCLYFLFDSQYFSKPKSSIAFAICFGLGMLLRWTFIFFLLGPSLIIFVKALLMTKSKKLLLIRLFSAFLIICSIVFPWYSQNFSKLYQYGRRTNAEYIERGESKAVTETEWLGKLTFSPFYIKDYAYYTLIRDEIERNGFLYLTLSISVCFSLAGVALAAGFIKKYVYAFALISSWALAVLLFSCIPTVDMRFLAPMAPIFPISGFFAASKMRGKSYLLFLVFSWLASFLLMFGWMLPLKQFYNIPYTDVAKSKFSDPIGIVTSPKYLFAEEFFAKEIAETSAIPCICTKYQDSSARTYLENIDNFRCFDSIMFLQMQNIGLFAAYDKRILVKLPVYNPNSPEEHKELPANPKLIKLTYAKPKKINRFASKFCRSQNGNRVSYDFCTLSERNYWQEHIDADF